MICRNAFFYLTELQFDNLTQDSIIESDNTEPSPFFPKVRV